MVALRPEQRCSDDNPARGLFVCTCAGTAASATNRPATCVFDECTELREPCSNGESCIDPVQTRQSVGDYTCTVSSAAAPNSGNPLFRDDDTSSLTILLIVILAITCCALCLALMWRRRAPADKNDPKLGEGAAMQAANREMASTSNMMQYAPREASAYMDLENSMPQNASHLGTFSKDRSTPRGQSTPRRQRTMGDDALFDATANTSRSTVSNGQGRPQPSPTNRGSGTDMPRFDSRGGSRSPPGPATKPPTDPRGSWTENTTHRI